MARYRLYLGNPSQGGTGGGDPSPLLILSSLLAPNLRDLTLACDAVALTVSPQIANLLYGRKVLGDALALTVSVQNANLNKGRTLVADSFALTVSPQAATLTWTHILPSSAVALTASVQNATLTYVPITGSGGGDPAPLLILSSLLERPSGIVGDTVAITATIQNAALRPARKLFADAIALTVSPQDAGLAENALGQGGAASPLLILSTLFGQASGYFFIPADRVQYSVTIRDAALRKGKFIAAETVALTVSLAPAERDLEMNGDSLSLSVSVQNANVYRSVVNPLTADALTQITVSLNEAFLRKEGNEKILGAFPVGMAVATQDATFLRGYVLTADGISLTARIQDAFMPGETLPSDEKKGGRGKKKRQKPEKYVVEIDGEDFVVESPEEAAALLQAARETFQEVVQQVKAEPKRAAVKMPHIRVSGPDTSVLDTYINEVSAARKDIRALYDEALAAMARAQQDEEEALMLLL